MEYRLLGRTGLRVSPLCLGTMNFGNQAEEAEGHRIMDRALELGINFFDTANVYGAPGLPTEEIIGRWLIQGERRRERTVIATKVYGGRDAWPNTSRLSARHIRESCERSLRRMQTDYIDLYQMHHVDRDTPWEEIWQAMEVLVQQGKILYVGSSNFAGWHIVKANERAARRNLLGLVSEQSLYNLNARTVELEVLPACRGLRRRRHPVEPARRRHPRRRPAEGHRGAPRRRADAAAGRADAADARSVGEAVRGPRRAHPPTWRWRGSCTTRR